MPRIKSLILALCLLLAAPAFAAEIQQSMTVDEAYAAIPHNKTRFEASSATMEASEKQFLDIFFGLTDNAVAERVIQQRNLGGGAADNYDVILSKLAALAVPEKLQTAHKLVTEAVEEQRDYIKKLKSGGSFNTGDPLVQSSHGKLVAAYNELMRLYPAENEHNKKAFYDHLCALDFM